MQERKRYKKGDDGFVAYLKNEFEMAERTGYRYIEAGKFAIMANIQPEAIWALANADNADVRAEATARAESGEVITFTTAREISAAKRASSGCTPEVFAAIFSRMSSRTRLL
jgi:hypothetical protein